MDLKLSCGALVTFKLERTRKGFADCIREQINGFEIELLSIGEF